LFCDFDIVDHAQVGSADDKELDVPNRAFALSLSKSQPRQKHVDLPLKFGAMIRN